MENKIVYRTLSHSFSDEFNYQTLTIEKVDNSAIITLPLQKISRDISMLKGFAFEEATRICFAAGLEIADMPFKRASMGRGIKNFIFYCYDFLRRYFK